MTRRKPPNVSWSDWVEHQIRDAERRGGFENLPGHGKPIEGLDEPRPDLAWLAAKLRRENLDISAILPPALALAKEVEDLPVRLAKVRSESAVRTIVEELNDRILKAHRRPQEGPPMRVMTQDVDAVVRAWREARVPVERTSVDIAPASSGSSGRTGLARRIGLFSRFSRRRPLPR